MQCKIQTLYNNKAVTQPQPLSYFYQLFPTDSEHGLHDGISVKVNTPADVRTIRVFSSWKRKCICLCFLQLLQHQVGGAVPGNHSSGVSFCHHLQLPEQGANCFKLELQTALNKKKNPNKNTSSSSLADWCHLLSGSPVFFVYGHAHLCHRHLRCRPFWIREFKHVHPSRRKPN